MLKPSMLGYAGTKDRRAKTSQWFSLRKVDPRRIASAAKEIRDVYVGNFSFSPINLKLGMLKGNRFRIALRNVTAPDEVVDEACSRFRERGFINYYGLQRFGSRPDAPTYDIGRLLLQANYREAIERILADDDAMPSSGGRTGGGGMRVRRALSVNPRDLIGALDQLARNHRMLYLHAYQSLVWNRCASERLRRFGGQPAVGDLVPLHCNPREYENDLESDDDESEEKVETEDKNKEESMTDDNAADGGDEEEVAEACKEKDKEAKEDNKEEKPEKKVQAKNVPKPKFPMKVLTEEDVASGRYTIFDVVLPVPGYNIEYPPNMVDYYRELLGKDNLKLEMRHKYKPFSLSGAYRLLCVRPGGLEWRAVRYRHPSCDLQLSDLQLLQGCSEADLILPQDGPYKALLLTMTLPASSYATMALRELLKVDTANDSQALQNDYHKKPLDQPEGQKPAAGTPPGAEEAQDDEKTSGDNTPGEESASVEDSASKADTEKDSEMSAESESQNEDRAEKRKMEGGEVESGKKPKQEPSGADLVNSGE